MIARENTKAFTLIELLIVVAIIAILAAIAVPNFLEAQTRSKVSHSMASMRAIATALEAYRIDHPTYPPYPEWGAADSWDGQRYLNCLSTPVAYISSADAFKDIFYDKRLAHPDVRIAHFNRYRYGSTYMRVLAGSVLEWRGGRSNGETSYIWELQGFGPVLPIDNAQHNEWGGIPYDPTNGTASIGVIFLTGPGNSFGNPAYWQ